MCSSTGDHVTRFATFEDWPARGPIFKTPTRSCGTEKSKVRNLTDTTSTNMTRTRGRSTRGSRLIAKVPHSHWKTTTFVAALRADGLTAPVVIDGALTGELHES